MKLEAGRRVYVPSTTTFGTIVREGGILGLAKSYAVVDDLGKKQVFVGDDIEFVYADSSEKLCGERVEIPQDIVPTLREEYTPAEAGKMTRDLYKLPPEERGKACDEILKKSTKKSKKTKKKTSERKPRKKSTRSS